MMHKTKVVNIIFFVFVLLSILFHPQKALPQNGIVKTIKGFEGSLGQHLITNTKLVFVEENENGIGDEDLWIYDIESKSIDRVSNSLEHYSNSFFIYENYILFNQNEFIVQYDMISKKFDTLSIESDNFISTDFTYAIRLGGSVYFTEDQTLWRLNTVTKELMYIGTEGYIIGNGNEHIYLRYRENINVYDITAGESIEVHSTDFNYNIVHTAVLGENMLFLYYRLGSTEMHLVKYNAESKITSTLEVPIERVNDDGLYVFHKIDDNRLIFYDKTSYKFWLYNNQLEQITEIDQVDNEGNALRSYGKFVSNTNEIFFWGYINGVGSSIIKYNSQTNEFFYVISIPEQYADTQYPLEFLESDRIITQVQTYQTNQRYIIDMDLVTGSIDTIAENPAMTNPIFFQNSLIYGMPTPSYGPGELYRYDFSLKQSTLIEGSYQPDEDVYTFQYRMDQYNNEVVFMWDNQGIFRTIDDSYIDEMVEAEACEYYVLLGDTLTESGYYRKKAEGQGPVLDTVYTLDLTINTLKTGVAEYSTGAGSSFLRASEQNADTYQWFSCEDKTPIPYATSRDFYYSSEGYYGVALTKGSCVDTTGCPVFVKQNQRVCGTYNFFGDELSSSGFYEFYQQNYNTVDTVFQLELIIDEINAAIVQKKDSLNKEYVYLISEEKDGDQYQWVNCHDFSPVEGETNSSFRASIEGEYALIISKGACQDTTSCYSPTILGVKKNKKSAIMHPNPTRSYVNIDLADFTNDCSIIIYDIAGIKVNEYTADQLRKNTLLKVSNNPGVYNICITDNDYFDCYKVVVE